MKMFAKMKELGPIGGVRPARPLDPPMVTTVAHRLQVTEGGDELQVHILQSIENSKSLMCINSSLFRNVSGNSATPSYSSDFDRRSSTGSLQHKIFNW